MERGLVQLYTGDGKGKTTAAFGQALRAAGRGCTVVIIQFLKAEDTGEVLLLGNRLPEIRVFRTARQATFSWSMDDSERKLAAVDVREGMSIAQRIMDEGETDLLVLDEIVTAASLGYCLPAELAAMARAKPAGMELVLTGRGADETLIAAADLVTEMRKLRHPFDRGIIARRGIES